MTPDDSGPNDPIRNDADAIGKDAADLGQRRQKELADDQQRVDIAAKKSGEQRQIDELRKEMAADDEQDAGLAADQGVQRAAEAVDEKDIIEKGQDAQRRTAGPGPTPAPQPPRPLVG